MKKYNIITRMKNMCSDIYNKILNYVFRYKNNKTTDDYYDSMSENLSLVTIDDLYP
jgi:hypothetical protein